MVFDCRKNCKNGPYCLVSSLCLDMGCNTSSILNSCLSVWHKWAILVCSRCQHTSYPLCNTCDGAQAQVPFVPYFSRNDLHTLRQALTQGILVFCTYDKYHSNCY